MAETVSVVIGTYGDLGLWTSPALTAMESAREQSVEPLEVFWRHGATLQDARNQAAAEVKADWLVHLDADDTLDHRYIEGILAGTGDLRQPKTLGVYPDGHEDPEPVLIPPKTSFAQGNWLVVGTAVRRSIFEAVGGWGPEELYEDWALWWRCWIAGAEIGTAPEAIYRVSVNESGRNLPDRASQVWWFDNILNRLQDQRAA